MKEGGIYFRYVGETRLIKPAELRQIIATREQRAIAEFGFRVRRVATGKDATINLDNGEVSGANGRFVIDRSLLSSIQFVREGEFTDQKGAPALKLIGDVVPISEAEKQRTHVIRENVTPDAAIRNFLRSEKVAEPLSYIQLQAFTPRRWMPIWFYVEQMGKPAQKIAADLKASVATHPSSRDAVVARLLEKDTAFRPAAGKAGELLVKLMKGDIDAPKSVKDDVVFAGAVQGLPDTMKNKNLITIKRDVDRMLGPGQRRSQGASTRCRLSSCMPLGRASQYEARMKVPAKVQ